MGESIGGSATSPAPSPAAGAGAAARSLPRHVRVLLRPGGRVQFGVGPGRALVWPLPEALPPGPVLAALLAATRGSCLVGGLTAVGLPTAVASALYSELERSGLAGPPALPGRVTVVGRDSVKWALVDELRKRAVSPAARVPDRAALHWLATAPAETIGLVVLTGMEVPDRELLAVLWGRGIPHVPVVLRDSLGIIGPYTRAPSGPCPMCPEHHRLDEDPARGMLALQLKATASAGPPEVVAATVATLMAHLPDPARLRAAEAVVDPIGLGGGVRAVVPHPGCGVCRGRPATPRHPVGTGGAAGTWASASGGGERAQWRA